ncbi:hypothetical protein niasHT_030964 [Heterodera trifolii]|uniref:Uncharacterized protein n=1 Tax=Heterodera trifolii TaxID=157864 RepID=A0ABD2J8K1_9BILA
MTKHLLTTGKNVISGEAASSSTEGKCSDTVMESVVTNVFEFGCYDEMEKSDGERGKSKTKSPFIENIETQRKGFCQLWQNGKSIGEKEQKDGILKIVKGLRGIELKKIERILENVQNIGLSLSNENIAKMPTLIGHFVNGFGMFQLLINERQMVIPPLASSAAENALVPQQKRRTKRAFELFRRHDGCAGSWSKGQECVFGASIVTVSILVIILCAFRLSDESKLHPLSHPGTIQLIALLSLIAFCVAFIIGFYMMLRGCFGAKLDGGSAMGRIC